MVDEAMILRNCIPSWLLTPADRAVSPPVETHTQELPFGQLSWENFEKLCMRLVREDSDVEECRIYGARGQSQHGIDILARLRKGGQYRVLQCKRVEKFRPAEIREAIRKFVDGQWTDKATTFVLCVKVKFGTTQQVNEIEKQAESLRSKGIDFQVWDASELSLKLKAIPLLVDDFFGREWVKAHCGAEQVQCLVRRLDAEQVANFRKKCAQFYRNVFATHDPGLPIMHNNAIENPSIEERFIPVDVYDWEKVAQVPRSDVEERSESDSRRAAMYESPDMDVPLRYATMQKPADVYQRRQTIEKWLAQNTTSVVLGAPGSGKSTLLRFVALDLLSPSPRLFSLAERWGQFLPIWIPFALWTKSISGENGTPCSITDLIQRWLKEWSEERLWPLFEKALEDDRLLLLVDGLDEYVNEDSARIALDRLGVFIKQRGLPAIITSRPHGFERLGFAATHMACRHACCPL